MQNYIQTIQKSVGEILRSLCEYNRIRSSNKKYTV